ncbi:hypothetical protein MHYP_G00109820 [Metynnis hypsauchen]
MRGGLKARAPAVLSSRALDAETGFSTADSNTGSRKRRTELISGLRVLLRRRSGGNGRLSIRCSRDSRLPAITERRTEDAAAEMDRPSQPLFGS